MVQTPKRLLTLEEFLELPETEPTSEYINGAIIQKAMPQGKHNILQRELSFILTATFRSDKTAQAFPELRSRGRDAPQEHSCHLSLRKSV